MANEKNLKPIRTKSEAREKGRKGGKKSAETRRQRKLLKDCMLDLLDLPVTNTKQWNQLSKLGVNPEEIDNRSLLTVALFMKATTGDVNAFKEIRNLIDEGKDGTDNGELERLMEDFKKL